jgi:hypothetical protein
MLSRQEEERERRETLENDRRVREQSRNGDTGTYLSHTHSEVGGRFAIDEHQTITGVVSPAPPPLPSTSPWSGAQPEPGPEEPLGYEINRLTPFELEPSMAQSSVDHAQAPGGAEAPSLSMDVEHAAPPSFSTKGPDDGTT